MKLFGFEVRRNQKTTMRKAMRVFTEREWAVMALLTGCRANGKPLNWTDVAEELKISYERVRQLNRQILGKVLRIAVEEGMVPAEFSAELLQRREQREGRL